MDLHGSIRPVATDESERLWMPRASPQRPPRGAPLGARLCDRLLFGKQTGSYDHLPSRSTPPRVPVWDDGGSPRQPAVRGSIHARSPPQQSNDLRSPADILSLFSGVGASSPALDRAAFTRQLAAAGSARRLQAAAASPANARAPPMSAREQQEREYMYT